MVENASDNGSLIPATPPVSTACMRDKPKRSGESVGSGGREKARKKEEEGDDGQIRLCCPRQSQPPLHFARARFEEQQKIEGGLKLKKPPPPPPVVPVCKPTSLSLPVSHSLTTREHAFNVQGEAPSSRRSMGAH